MRHGQDVYIASAVRLLVSMKGKTKFTTFNIYETYWHIIPSKYRVGVKEFSAHLRRNSQMFGIERDGWEDVPRVQGEGSDRVIRWRVRETFLKDSSG